MRCASALAPAVSAWLVAIFVLAPATATAQMPHDAVAVAGPMPPKAQESRSQLAPGDRLTTTIFDQPELSGAFIVEPSGDVVFPLIGPIAVAGSTIEEFQATLRAKLADGYIQNPSVVVRLAELRPVTVVGLVRTPGRYAFLEGMTVATALALSGGMGLLTNDEALARADFLAAEERVSAQRVNHVGQIARRARLEASLAGSPLEAPTVEPQDKEIAARFLAAEEKVLTARRESLERQRSVLAEQSKQITADIEVFSEQLTLEQEQIALLDKQVESVRKLLANGLTRQASLIDLERERSRSRANLAQLTGSLARARSLQVEAQYRLEQIETVARNEDIFDLQVVNQQIAETEATMPLSSELRDVRRMRLSRLPPAVDTPPAISLTRYRDGAFVRSVAGLSDPVWPGDLVQVGSDADVLQASPGPSAALPNGSGAWVPSAPANEAAEQSGTPVPLEGPPAPR